MKGNAIKMISVFIALLVTSAASLGQIGDYYMESYEAPHWEDSTLTPAEGATFIENKGEFYRLAGQVDIPGAVQMSEVKFLVTDVMTDSPRLYFLNSSSYKYHWKFYSNALGWNMDLLSFNTRTYTDFNRRLIAGSVVRYGSYSSEEYPDGVYSVEFWPSDPIHADEASLVMSLLQGSMPFASHMIVYHPTGETQVRLFTEETAQFEEYSVKVMHTAELYEGVSYSALNTGVACGILRYGGDSGTWSTGDIVVFETIPNDISHVAGVITTIPQTPLSHINLKARQNGTPNVFIENFTESSEYQSLLGGYVRLTVQPGSYRIESIPLSEASLWLESIRPENVTVLHSDLSENRILSLENLRLESSVSYGAKAANIGELSRCLPSESVPGGYAIPFAYYNEYMEYNNFYSLADSLTALEEFASSVEAREEILAQIRRTVRGGTIPHWMMDSLDVMTNRFEPGISLRCRSSTNNEDLPGFNGAGLYESYTHHGYEGHISETVKQVWAGIWTYRAFEEREFHRIDHNSACMGVVVHPSFRDETANGVAVTQNIFNPFITGYYVNVQAGEDMITNPEPESVPEEFLVTKQYLTGVWQMEVQYIGSSNRIEDGERVLTEEQIDLLEEYLEDIHNHFARVYGEDSEDSGFAMEIEFKITSGGELVVKQARPWVSGSG